MPTNALRQKRKPDAPPARATPATRHVVIRAGRAAIRARLLDTPTAERIWQALPLYSTAQIRDRELFFETVVESGRERGARLLLTPGEIAFAPDRDAVVIVLPRAAASGGREVRVRSLSNIWAIAVDDVAALTGARPGEKVEVVRA